MDTQVYDVTNLASEVVEQDAEKPVRVTDVHTSPLVGTEFGKPLVDAGLLPPWTVGFTLRCYVKEIVTLTVERYLTRAEVAAWQKHLKSAQFERPATDIFSYAPYEPSCK